MKEKTEVKKNIDDMAGKLFEYITTACDEKEAENKKIEQILDRAKEINGYPLNEIREILGNGNK